MLVPAAPSYDPHDSVRANCQPPKSTNVATIVRNFGFRRFRDLSLLLEWLTMTCQLDSAAETFAVSAPRKQ